MTTNSIRAAILSGLAARFYVALLNILSVPVLLRWIGVEAFGLIGLLTTIQAIFSILDSGLASSVMREVAAMSGPAREDSERLIAIRGAEHVYWIVTPIFLAFALIFAATFFNSWRGNTALGVHEAAISIGLLCASASLLWPMSCYNAVLCGLRRQSTVALISAVVWTMRIGGGLLVLWLTAHRPSAFFACQLVSIAAGTFALRCVVAHVIPSWKTCGGSVRTMLSKMGRAASAVSLVAAALLVFNQMDKLIVGKIFSLELFGYYSLAWQLAGSLYLIYNPLYNTYLPEISRLATKRNFEELNGLVEDAMTVMSLFVIPVSAVLVTMAHQVLFAWTGSTETTAHTTAFLSLAFAGASVNALMFIPYAVQQATHTTSITLRAVLFSIGVAAPTMIIGALYGGARCAIAAWAACSWVQVGAIMYVTARRVLKRAPWRWIWSYIISLGLPSILVAGGVAMLIPEQMSRWTSGVAVMCTYTACMFLTIALNAKLRIRIRASCGELRSGLFAFKLK